MKKIEYILKHNLFIQKLYVIFFSAFFKFISIFIKKNKKQILFQSMIGKNFDSSPKTIYDAILADHFFDDYELVWAFENPRNFEIPRGKKIKLNSFSYFINAIKSKVWVGNSGIERSLRFKPKGTIYINTFHGASFKVDGNAQKNRKDYNFSDVDYQCATSEFNKDIIVRDWKIRKEVVDIKGFPCDDELYKLTNSKIENIKKQKGIPLDKKVICYAPTWRDVKTPNQKTAIENVIDFNKWKKELSDKYIILFRAHHLTEQILNVKYDDFVFDGTKNFSTNEALAISDILISDYSSILFDYSILKRPMLSFAYDLEDYKKNRGLYFDPQEVFTTVNNEKELLNHIKNLDISLESNKSKLIKEKYMVGDGSATIACINFIKSRL